MPFIGPDLALWIRGDYVVSDATLNRFFAFHVIAIPLVLLGLVAAHIAGAARSRLEQPRRRRDQEDTRARDGMPLDGIPFHPYYTVKDLSASMVFLSSSASIVFFVPEMGGYFLEYNNFIPADPLKTPEHIAPVWYFTPYYSILRAVPPLFDSQFPGVLAMGVGHHDPVLPALARPQPGEVDPLPRPLYKTRAGARSSSSFLVLGYLGTSRPRLGPVPGALARCRRATTSPPGSRASAPSSTSCSSS